MNISVGLWYLLLMVVVLALESQYNTIQYFSVSISISISICVLTKVSVGVVFS